MPAEVLLWWPYILDVDGQRQVFLTFYLAATSDADLAELQIVLDSIDIEPWCGHVSGATVRWRRQPASGWTGIARQSFRF